MPKATISIIVCCEHNLEIKAEVFELCNSCNLSCATVVPYVMICTELNVSAVYWFAVCQSVTAVTLQYDYMILKYHTIIQGFSHFTTFLIIL